MESNQYLSVAAADLELMPVLESRQVELHGEAQTNTPSLTKTRWSRIVCKVAVYLILLFVVFQYCLGTIFVPCVLNEGRNDRRLGSVNKCKDLPDSDHTCSGTLLNAATCGGVGGGIGAVSGGVGGCLVCMFAGCVECIGPGAGAGALISGGTGVTQNCLHNAANGGLVGGFIEGIGAGTVTKSGFPSVTGKEGGTAAR